MNRSTLRSVSAVLASAAIALSLSPLAANAQTAPTTGSGAGQVRTLEIAYGDGDDGPYYVDTSNLAARPTPVVLAPGDVLYGDADQGPIAEGPTPVTAASPVDLANASSPPAQDLVFSDDGLGGMPVDRSAFGGRTNISMTELAGGQSTVAQNGADIAELPGDE
jgi:hypothetical protein